MTVRAALGLSPTPKHDAITFFIAAPNTEDTTRRVRAALREAGLDGATISPALGVTTVWGDEETLRIETAIPAEQASPIVAFAHHLARMFPGEQVLHVVLPDGPVWYHSGTARWTAVGVFPA